MLPEQQIRTFPVREGIVKHNKTIMYVFMGILIYLMIGLLNVILITSVGMTVSKLEPIKIFTGPYGFIPATALGISILLWILTIYSVITINKTNKRLTGEYIQRTEVYNPSLTGNVLICCSGNIFIITYHFPLCNTFVHPNSNRLLERGWF